MISARDFILSLHKQIVVKYCSCGCGKPLEPRVDGQRHAMGGQYVNADCYFDSLGGILEEFPIGGIGLRRRGSTTSGPNLLF
jgi:hypothetical protein